MRVNNIKKYTLLSLIFTVIMLFAVACGQSVTNSTEESSTDTETISLSHSSLDLSIGEIATITATVTPEGLIPDWNVVGDGTIIVFNSDSGLVTAVGVGKAMISAQVGYSRAECSVNVSQNIVGEYSVNLNRTSTQVTVEQQINLTATVMLGSVPVDGATITWSVVEGEAVSVTQNGVVTAEQEGSAVVRATYSPDVNTVVTADCAITVFPKLVAYTLYPDGEGNSERLVMKNEVFTVNPKVLDENGEPVDVSLDEIVFSTEKSNIVEYLGDGRFRALKAGTSNIRAEYKGVDGYCDIQVWGFTADMVENVGGGWGGWVTMQDDGRLHYNAPVYAGAVALKDSAFVHVKQLAEEQGYTNLSLTLYSVDGNLRNVFANGKYTEWINADGLYNDLKETAIPVKLTVPYDTFKDWTALQLFYSNWVETNIVFTLTLEKYVVTATDQFKMVEDTVSFADLNAVVLKGENQVEGLTYEDFIVTSHNPDIVTYENGVFKAKSEGMARISVEYGGTVTYVKFTVLGNVYNLTADMLENVGNSWGGWVTAQDNGKLLYNAPVYASAVALKDAAFAEVKQMVETFGYTKLVATIYSVDSKNLCNIFREGKWNYDTGNVQGKFNELTEQDAPVRFEIDCDTFKNWASMQVLYSNWADTNAIFTLTLEKYGIKAEDQMVGLGATFDFAKLKVVVTDGENTIANLTYANFEVTSLNADVVTYENGVFTAKNSGGAVICIAYNGCTTYVMVNVLKVNLSTATKVNLADIMSLAGLTYWYAPNATLTDLGNGRLKIDNPTENNNCGWKLTGEQLALVRNIAAEFGFNKLTIEVYANPNGVLAAQGGSVAGNFPDKGFFWQVGGSVISTPATDENPIKGSPRDDIFAENMLGYWNEIYVGVHGIGAIEFSLFLEKV